MDMDMESDPDHSHISRPRPFLKTGGSLEEWVGLQEEQQEEEEEDFLATAIAGVGIEVVGDGQIS